MLKTLVKGLDSYKYLIAIIVLSCIVVISSFRSERKLRKELIGTRTEYTQLTSDYAKLAVVYAEDLQKSSEIIASLTSAAAEYSRNLEKLSLKYDETLRLVSDVSYKINQKARISNAPDITLVDDETGTYVIHELRFDNGPAVGYVMIFPDGTLKSKLYKHEYRANLMVVENDKTGQHQVTASMDYILKAPSINPENWYDKRYSLPITNGVAYVNPVRTSSSERFRLINSKLVGIASTNGFGMGIALTQLKRPTRDFTFLSLGLIKDYNSNNFGVSFAPVTVTPYKKLFRNTEIGVTIDYINNEARPGISLQIGL